MLKQLAKRVVVALLWRRVESLCRNNDIKIVAVAGSIGKTSTKRAIAQVLSQKYSVAWQDGNYNDIVSVPLVFFGLNMPSLLNPLAWLVVLMRMSSMIRHYPYEVVVLELGTDAPGQIAEFGKYIKVDVGVITPIAPEHMEFFESIKAVAKEELSLQKFSNNIIVYDKTLSNFASLVEPSAKSYGQTKSSTSSIDTVSTPIVIKTDQLSYSFTSSLLGKHQLENLSAVCLVAEMLNLSPQQIIDGLESITAMPGRMQKLEGIKGSVIIDDTYNSSPEAVKAAIESFYELPGTKKIAVLGNMNELGSTAKDAHIEVGKLCSPKKVDLIITIGPDANEYVAKTAEAQGCKVLRSDSPYAIGKILLEEVAKDSLILLKGSQNGVFLEEAIKPILANSADTDKLVRQSNSWLAKKRKMFS